MAQIEVTKPCPSCGKLDWESSQTIPGELQCGTCGMVYESAVYFIAYAELIKEHYDVSDVNEDETAAKTHGPGKKSWGPKTERCILKWERDHPGDPKSKMVAICRTMHKDS